VSTKKKKYPVTEEIIDLFAESMAAKNCRDEAINCIWGTKRAIKYGKIYILLDSKAWRLVYKLYPELVGKPMTFKRVVGEIIVE